DAALALVAEGAEEVVERACRLALLVHVDDGLAERLVEVGEVVVAVLLELLDAAQLGRPDLEHEVDEIRQRNSLHEASSRVRSLRAGPASTARRPRAKRS